MKRKVLILCLCLLIIFSALMPGCGNVSSVRRDIISSQSYTQSDVDKAMDTVVSHFRANFKGCTLSTLSYDGTASTDEEAEWAKLYGEEQAIVLVCSFDVGNKSDGSLSPNTSYNNWKWLLTRSGGAWKLQTGGYG